MKKSILIIPILLAVLSLACSFSIDLGQNTPVPEDAESGDSVATAVAATLAAAGGETPIPPIEEAGPTPTWTIHPTITASPDYTYQGVSLYWVNQIANSASPQNQSAMGEGPFPMPAFLDINLGGYSMPGGYFEPTVRVISVADFSSVNSAAGDALDDLEALLASQPADPDTIPIPDFWGAAQFLACQKDYVRFQNGNGIRYVTQWGQAAYPVGFPQMFYSYQGLTDDGAYYLHVFFSVGHPSLPDPENVVQDQAFYDNYQNYVDQAEIQLDGETPDSFQPSLYLLDNFVSQIRVEAP